jgi:hypothetical protein
VIIFPAVKCGDFYWQMKILFEYLLTVQGDFCNSEIREWVYIGDKRMEKILENGYRTWVLLSFFTILCSGSIARSYQNIVTFDSLFPVTWYQKSLEASLSVWQTISNAFEKNDGGAISFYELLGKMTFAQFCISRMIQERVVCLPEDSAYLGVVLNKVKELVDVIVVSDENEDVILCIHDVILNIEQQVLQLP